MKTTILTLTTLALASAGWAQERAKETGWRVELPRLRQLTVQGLYGENKLVRSAGSPLLGLTYSHYTPGEIHVGELEGRMKGVRRLHLPSGGWFVDALTGSRAGTRVNSLGYGVAMRLTSTALEGESGPLNRWYYGAGLGLYATRVEAARSRTGVGLGTRLFVGKDFTDGSLLELGYSYRPGTQGVHPTGVTLGLGRRF